jgi:hypothetical protein
MSPPCDTRTADVRPGTFMSPRQSVRTPTMSGRAKRDTEEEAFPRMVVETSPWLDWTGKCCSVQICHCPHSISMEAARWRAVRRGKLARRMVRWQKWKSTKGASCGARPWRWGLKVRTSRHRQWHVRGVERRDCLAFFASVGKNDGMTETC